jgi:hypothetical protein
MIAPKLREHLRSTVRGKPKRLGLLVVDCPRLPLCLDCAAFLPFCVGLIVAATALKTDETASPILADALCDKEVLATGIWYRSAQASCISPTLMA